MPQTKRRKFYKVVPSQSLKKVQYSYAKLIVTAQMVVTTIVLIGFYMIFTFFANPETGFKSEDAVTLSVVCMIVCIFFTFFLAFLSALDLSHRFVGPIYRIDTLLREAFATGKLPVLTIRKDDELQEFVQLLNQVLEKQRTGQLDKKV